MKNQTFASIARQVLTLEGLTLKELMDNFSYKQLITLRLVGDTVHEHMHFIIRERLFGEFNVTKEQVTIDHDILVANIDTIDIAIRHHEKFDIVYYNERPMYFHVN